MFLAIPLVLACSEPPTPPPRGAVDFVRGGVVTPGIGSGGQPLPDGRRLLARPWTPGETLQVDGIQVLAPPAPACLRLATTELGPLAPDAPPPALSFEADGSLTVHLGAEALSIDAWTGRITRRGPAAGAPDPRPDARAAGGHAQARAQEVVVTAPGGPEARCAAEAPLAATVALADDGRVAGVETPPGGGARAVVWR